MHCCQFISAQQHPPTSQPNSSIVPVHSLLLNNMWWQNYIFPWFSVPKACYEMPPCFWVAGGREHGYLEVGITLDSSRVGCLVGNPPASKPCIAGGLVGSGGTLTEVWWDGKEKRRNICKWLVGDAWRIQDHKGCKLQKKKKSVGQKIVQELWLGLSESGHWPYARAWWTVFSASKLVDISHNPLQHAPTLKRLQFQTKPNWLNPRKSVPLPSSPGLRRSPVRFLPFHASPHYGRALHGQLPSCACIWSHGVEKDTAGVKPRRGWEVIGGTNGDRDRTYYLLR